jgi:hypothetical protein
VHRDIKPSNLLLADAHGPASLGVVKVLDMGLARIDAGENHGNETTADELTKTGSIMGTSDYMAPEQAMNAKSADHRADIYSLGCTLYFFLTGNPPFEGETAMAKVFAHREQPIPQLPPKVRHLQSILTRMMAKRPEDRYPAMTDVIAALESAGQPRRRRVLPLVLLGGGAIAAAALVLAFSLGDNAAPTSTAMPVVAPPTTTAVVRPTGLVQAMPDKAIPAEIRRPAPPTGFILNQKPASSGPGIKQPDGMWKTERAGGLGTPGGNPEREAQRLQGEAERVMEMLRNQALKPADSPAPPNRR